MTTDETLPMWIRRQLERNEWNQADFARKVGASTGRVSEWLSGARIPNPESCDRIADAFGVDVTRVMVLAGHLPCTNGEPDPLRADLLAAARRVPKRRVGEAISLLKAITEPQD